MNENNPKKKHKKNKKSRIKCNQCEFYDALLDYCSEKDIKECSRQSHINFSACNDFLIREDLVMF